MKDGLWPFSERNIANTKVDEAGKTFFTLTRPPTSVETDVQGLGTPTSTCELNSICFTFFLLVSQQKGDFTSAGYFLFYKNSFHNFFAKLSVKAVPCLADRCIYITGSRVCCPSIITSFVVLLQYIAGKPRDTTTTNNALLSNNLPAN